MAKPNGVAVIVWVGVWMCGYLVQAQTEVAGLFTQDMVPRESKTCKDIRYNLEMMMFNTYKGFIQRHLLKQVLSGLAEPLLPLECIRGGGDGKWLLDTPSPADQVSTPAGGLPEPSLAGRVSGDHPALRRRKRSADEEDSEADMAHVRHKRANGEEEKKGPNMDAFSFSPFLFGDVPDHRASSPMFPISQSMFASLRQLFTPRRNPFFRQSRVNAARQNRYGPKPNVFYGNAPHYRRASVVRQAPVSPPVAPVSPPVAPVSPPVAPLSPPVAPLSPPVAPLSPPVAPPRTQAAVPAAQPVPPLNLAPAVKPLLIQSPASQPLAAPSNLVQPAATQPLGPQPAATQPLLSGFSSLLSQSTSSQTPSFSPPYLRHPAPAQTQPRVSGTGGMIFGDKLPTFSGRSLTASRRVKRASDNSSPSDVVTFGDFSMPADTFDKLISPRDRYSDDTNLDSRGPRRSYNHPPPPPPRRYNHVVRRPVYYPRRTALRQPAPIYQRGYPFTSPFVRARQARILNARRRAHALAAANQVARPAPYVPASRGAPLVQLPAAGMMPQQRAPAAGRMPQQVAPAAGMMPPAAMGPAAPMMPLSLPLGAAQPVYGTHPAY